jgi:hypothetical protein
MVNAAATVSAAEFAIVVDDPVARCARPAPNPRLRASIIAADVIIDRPSSIVAPNRKSRKRNRRRRLEQIGRHRAAQPRARA